MLETIMKHLRNYFLTNVRKDGSFKIEDGNLSLLFVREGQFIMITGSSFNDGVYRYPVSNLVDETFDGSIVILNPPKDFLKLVEEIEAYQTKTSGSEGYSYTRGTNANGGVADWSIAFKDRLNVWRKI